MAGKQNTEYAHTPKKGKGRIASTQRQGKQKGFRLNCQDGLTKLKLMGEVLSSKENAVDYERFIQGAKALMNCDII